MKLGVSSLGGLCRPWREWNSSQEVLDLQANSCQTELEKQLLLIRNVVQLNFVELFILSSWPGRLRMYTNKLQSCPKIGFKPGNVWHFSFLKSPCLVLKYSWYIMMDLVRLPNVGYITVYSFSRGVKVQPSSSLSAHLWTIMRSLIFTNASHFCRRRSASW